MQTDASVPHRGLGVDKGPSGQPKYQLRLAVSSWELSLHWPYGSSLLLDDLQRLHNVSISVVRVQSDCGGYSIRIIAPEEDK